MLNDIVWYITLYMGNKDLFEKGDYIVPGEILTHLTLAPPLDIPIQVRSTESVPKLVEGVGHSQWITIMRVREGMTEVFAEVWAEDETANRVQKWVGEEKAYFPVKYSGAHFVKKHR